MGIKDDRHVTWSSEVEFAMEQFSESLKFDGDSYEVVLPWKKDTKNLIVIINKHSRDR